MKPLVGLSLWDRGGWGQSGKTVPPDPDYYERILSEQLSSYKGLLTAAELAQEAPYQNRDIRTWSNLRLMDTCGFKSFLLDCRRLALHLRHNRVDIADHESGTHRRWSLNEVKAGLEFAMALGADYAVLHPGTYNERSGRFWPPAEEVTGLTVERGRALEESLAELAGVIAGLALEQEERLQDFEKRERTLFDDVSGLLEELRRSSCREDRIRLSARVLDIVDGAGLTVEQFRHCLAPWSGMHVCLENLEPPNFLVCTPAQVKAVYERFREFYDEACSHRGLSTSTAERYKPKLALSPGHLLNTKVILTQPNNRAFLESIYGGAELESPFVGLPGQFPSDPGCAGVQEPLLNRFIRLNGDDVHVVHLFGCRRMDTCMTTHDPVKTFRTSVLLEEGPDGRILERYGTGNYRPDEELNLEEVVQVIGPSVAYIVEVFGAPLEVVKASAINTYHYIEYLLAEQGRAFEDIRRAIAGEYELSSADPLRRARLDEIGTALPAARAYMRPRPGGGDAFWSVGYDEIGFYRFVEDPAAGNVDIFATVKQEDRKVWLKAGETGTP